nr:MFS transporter [Parvibium lacunae]
MSFPPVFMQFIQHLQQHRLMRLGAVLLLGFSSGLPLALTGQAMQAWLTVDGVDMATIGLFSLVGLPYTFKFLWAPLMDRFELPWLGRRRGWLVLTQLGLAVILAMLSHLQPATDTQLFALLALLVAFLSASQDVVVDAYRTDCLSAPERGLGASLSVFGYRLAMIVSGGIALIWADPVQGFGWGWGQVYQVMAGIMLLACALSLCLLPPLPHHLRAPASAAQHDLRGFVAVLITVLIGYQMTQHLFTPLMKFCFTAPKWANLAALLLGVMLTLPLVLKVARWARFETFNQSLHQYFSQPAALSFMLLIILYKLGDAFAGSLTTPFLIKALGFTQAEVGVVNKIIGIWMTIIGALLGGTLMLWLGLFRALWLFGLLQLLSNLGFYWLATQGKGAWGGIDLPAFDWVIIALKQATPVDYLLVTVIAFENITGGMGTAAFVALLTSLCHQQFSATQYALLSAFAAIGRVWVGPVAGVLAESIGWPVFFLVSIALALPGLAMLWPMRRKIQALA